MKMSHLKDDETFRWFQDSAVDHLGIPRPTMTYRVTMGQVRAELGIQGLDATNVAIAAAR